MDNQRHKGHQINEPDIVHIEISRDKKIHESERESLNRSNHGKMSPLTIDTDFQHQYIYTKQIEKDGLRNLPGDDKRIQSTPSPFYYSQIEGPLKSPGIFVPYADDKTRERLEHAIREVFEKNAPSHKTEILQPFPLQDPPKPKFKRQISTDSNESLDNRVQKFPSKKPQNTNSGALHSSISTQHSRSSFEEIGQTEESGVGEQSSYTTRIQKKQDINDGYVVQLHVPSDTCEIPSMSTSTEKCQTVPPRKGHAKRPLNTNCSINIPETPYTKNLEWVISDPSPNSVHDFIPATPTPVLTDTSYGSSHKKNSKTSEYKHQGNTFCVNDFSSEFQNESFIRDAAPVCTSSTVSDVANSKVTEKGFVFPFKSNISEPVLFSPRIASDKLRLPFESTTKVSDDSFSRTIGGESDKQYFDSTFHGDKLRSPFISTPNLGEDPFSRARSGAIDQQYFESPFHGEKNVSVDKQYFEDQRYQEIHHQQQGSLPNNISPSKSCSMIPNQYHSYKRDSPVYKIDSPVRLSSRLDVPARDKHLNEQGSPSKSPNRTGCSSLVSKPERQGCSWNRSPNRQHFENLDRARLTKGINRESVSELMMESFNSTLSRSTSHSNHYSSPKERTNGYRKVVGLLQSTECSDQSLDGYNGSGNEHERYTIVREMLRPYSMIELSPSKSDIDRMREKVRTIYRSLSSPMEMKQMLKNLLIEERMKEEFNVDEVFEDSFTSESSMTSTSRHSRGACCQGSCHGYSEIQYPDARRRLFEERQQDECAQRLFPKEINQRLDCTDARDSRVDLTDILDEMYRERTQELYDEQMWRNSQNFEETGHHAMYVGANRSPNRLSRKYQMIGGEPAPMPERELDCNMPGCSHTQTRIQRDISRKRKRGDLEVHVSCEDDEVSIKSRNLQSALKKVEHAGGKNCSCANIESSILEMARNAYQKIRRMDSSEYSFDRFNNEASETREHIFDSVKVLCGIKSMCKYGRIIEDMFTGSIIFVINSPTLLALEDLWCMFDSGELRTVINNTFLTEKLKDKYNCPSARLEVHIAREDYERARKELRLCEIKSPKLNTSLSKSDTEIASVCSSSKENYTFERSPRKKVKPTALAIIHMRSQSAPSVNQSPSPSPLCLSPLSNSPFSKERKFSFSNIGEKSPRKAFQEINPVSPSTKKVFDFDVNITSKLSPKRKTFGELPPWENKNVQLGTSPKRRSIRD